MFTDQDHQMMARALELARQGLYTTMPNPRVGCVIVKNGQIIGEGFHQRAGEPHAELIALLAARALVGPEGIAGSTLYITLEPCNHFGRTPPCATALIEARIGRVVAAMEDPNPLVAGAGFGALRHAGVDVRCGLLKQEAAQLNVGFISRMTRGVPWTRLKVAASLDGRTALANGTSQWITGEAARRDGHAWRARSCALLTGIGTVRDDDPLLTVRMIESPRQPLRVLIDSKLELSLDAKLLQLDATQMRPPLLVLTAQPDRAKADALNELGVEVIELPNQDGKVDLPAMLKLLGRRGINELHVEAGEKLNSSLLSENCVDELLIYLAPSILGSGRGMFALPVIDSLEQRRQLIIDSVDRIEEDLRVIARVKAFQLAAVAE